MPTNIQEEEHDDIVVDFVVDYDESLLKETIYFMEQHGKTIEDVAFVSSLSQGCTWPAFAEVALKFQADDYDVSEHIRIAFNDGSWLERCQDDMGNKYWTYMVQPKKPEELETVVDDRFITGWKHHRIAW